MPVEIRSNAPKTVEAMARSEGMSSGSIALRLSDSQTHWLGDFESTVHMLDIVGSFHLAKKITVNRYG